MVRRRGTGATHVPHSLALDSGHTLMHNNVLLQSSCNSIINSQPRYTIRASQMFTPIQFELFVDGPGESRLRKMIFLVPHFCGTRLA